MKVTMMNEGNTEKTCPACGTRLRPHMRFCSSCGVRVERHKENVVGPGTQKYCPQCGTSLRPDLKYCENCGAVIDQLPRCPACGDPISPGERFCNMCGIPLTGTTGPAAPAAAVPEASRPAPTAPPASSPGAEPAGGVKKGGLPIGKIVAGAVIVLVLLVVMALMLPDGGGTTIKDDTVDNAATQESIREAEALKQNVAQAVRDGDASRLRSMLTASTREQTGDSFIIPASDAQTVASAIESAKLVTAYPDMVVYEMTTDGMTESFYIT